MNDSNNYNFTKDIFEFMNNCNNFSEILFNNLNKNQPHNSKPIVDNNVNSIKEKTNSNSIIRYNEKTSKPTAKTSTNKSVKCNNFSGVRLADFVKKTVFRNPYTIIFWTDGTITKIKCNDADAYDPEKGFAMAFIKYYFGNRYYRDMLKILNNSEIISEPFVRIKNTETEDISKNTINKLESIEFKESIKNTDVEISTEIQNESDQIDKEDKPKKKRHGKKSDK